MMKNKMAPFTSYHVHKMSTSLVACGGNKMGLSMAMAHSNHLHLGRVE